MKYEELKHVLNGRFRLSWLFEKIKGSDEYEWKYYATYNSREDAEEFLERYVKPAWPDVKWEIEDTL